MINHGGSGLSYYDGIRTFKGYLDRVFGRRSSAPYDWADLSDDERERYVRREANEPRERRKEPRT